MSERYPSGRMPIDDILKARTERLASAFPPAPIWATESGWPPAAVSECGDTVVLWPEFESIDYHCDLPAGHDGRHEERGKGSWDEQGVDSFEWAKNDERPA